MSEGVVVTIASAKGGVGKTTTAINLGTAAVANTQRSVLLLEADLAMANVLDFLSLPFRPERDPSLHEVLADRASVAEATFTATTGLDVLPSGETLDGLVDADPGNIVSVIESARSSYDVVIVDTAAGVSMKTLLPLGIADGVVLVSTPRVAAIRDTQKTYELVGRVGGEATGVVLTQVGTGNAPSADRLANFLGVPLLGSVPADEAVNRSQDAGEAVVTYDPTSPAAEGYLGAAEAIGLTTDRSPLAPEAGDSG